MTLVLPSLRRAVPKSVMIGSILLVFLAVFIIIIYTNKTLHSIEKNLPTTLFGELNSLSMVLEDISRVVSSASIAAVTEDSQHIALLRSDILRAHTRIVELRNTYVANNMVNASAFHAVIAPAIADLQIWLADGVSGYAADSSIALNIIRERITKAFHKAAKIKYESWAGAQDILEKERHRLESFQSSVNVLFVLTLVLACMLIFLLFRQINIKNKEIVANKEIQQQHALLTSLLQHIPMGVAVWNKDKEIIHLNSGFTEITGYDSTDLRRLSDWPSLAYPDPLYRKQTIQHWKAIGMKGAIGEYRVTCKNGMVREIEFRIARLSDLRVICTLNDVTERNRNEKALQESRLFEARAKKMESLGLLAGGVAHDLNNILSGIVSYPELLLFELPEDHKMRRPIEIMRESGLRASAIVQDLLTVARGVAVAKKPINLLAIIEDYLQSPDFKMIEHYHPGITLSTSLAADTANIMGSRVHIRKILMNLVSNGFEASTPPGHVTISLCNQKIDALTRGDSEIEEGDYVTLTVADHGKGITSEDLEKIFEPFYSKKIMGRSGTGLGLTVVWNVVQDHRGYIKVSSSEKGTQFILHFPVTDKQEQLSEPAVDLARLTTGRGETVLVVDDVGTQRLITASIVEKLGYRVESVPSGESALEYLRFRPVDLVILDMIMSPGINGRVTYERILQMHPGQKAIIVSGYAETDEVKEALRLGAGKFLKKPLMIQELASAIKEELHSAPRS